MEFEHKSLDCLIPGLPNDLALQCLVRVPRIRHGYLKCVNSVWRCVVGGSLCYRERKRLALAEESVLIIREHHVNGEGNGTEPIAQCIEFDMKSQTTSKVLAVWSHSTARGMFLRGQACVQMQENVLFIGGYNRVDSFHPSSQVYKFCILTKKMCKGASMLNSRAQFAWAVIADRLYVAGGKDATGEWTQTAEVYDSSEDRWSEIANMPRRIQVYSGFRHGTQFLVQGFVKDKESSKPAASGEIILIYDPASNKWKEETKVVGNYPQNPNSVVVSTDEDNLFCATLESAFLTPFADDASSATLRISKLVQKDKTTTDEGEAGWKWETLKILDRVCTMSVFTMHGLADKAVIVIPYDLSTMSRWNALGYSIWSRQSGSPSCARKEVMICGGEGPLVEVGVRCCYCYNCSFTSANLRL